MYFGKNSTRWALKAYHKGDEVQASGKGHRIPDELPHKEKLVEWAQGVVRFEITLRAKELEKIDLAKWQPLQVWQQYFEKITWNRNVAACVEPDMLEVSLPVRLQGTLALWRQGTDLRQRMSKTAFYRARRELLAQCGVDIASPPPPKVPAEADVRSSALDPEGWDPEPLQGYAWNPRQRDLE